MQKMKEFLSGSLNGSGNSTRSSSSSTKKPLVGATPGGRLMGSGLMQRMDFFTNKMTGRGSLSRVIYVKPYATTDDEDEGEKENINKNNKTSTKDGGGKGTLSRTRSLEGVPSASKGRDEKVVTSPRRRSFERARGRSVGTPELAPVFITNNINTDALTQPEKSPVTRKANW